MARNEEKQLARLNRLLLKQNKEDQEKKNPRRPRLDDLHTGDEIKKWIPSIKRDIDFCLKQSQVPCYPEEKIQECNTRIDHLRRVYWAFVRKLRHLDPSTGSVPWTDRGYTSRKRPPTDGHTDEEVKKGNYDIGESHSANNLVNTECVISDSDPDEVSPCIVASSTDPVTRVSTSCPEVTSPDDPTPDPDLCGDFRPISTPILQEDDAYQTLYGYEPPIVMDSHVNSDLQDRPLTFVTKQCSSGENTSSVTVLQHSSSSHTDNTGTSNQSRSDDLHPNPDDDVGHTTGLSSPGDKPEPSLGLIPYSDSSGEDS